ncbi:hypothetical protein ACC757_23715 [Rhizobium ruizarguesonis]
MVLVPRADNPAVFVSVGRIDRVRAVLKIGCSPSVLRQNPGIKRLIKALERDDLLVSGPSECYPRVETSKRDSSNVIKFPKQKSMCDRGKLVVVPVTINGTELQIPTLLWPNVVDWEVSDWLRALAIDHSPLTTLTEYGKILRAFVRFRRRHQVLWEDVDDAFLRLYREHKLRRGIQVRTANRAIGIIFRHYLWAESTLRLCDHVQLYDKNEYPIEYQRHRFAISSKEVTNSLGFKTRGSVVSLPDRDSKYPARHTPSEVERSNLNDAELNSKHSERNSLLYAWAEVTGARRFEVLQLTCAHLPSWEQIDRILEGKLVWSIAVMRKGNRMGKLFPTGELLRRTKLLVEFEREQIVRNCLKKGVAADLNVFLTDAGKCLALSTLSGISGLAFRRAGISRSSYHRLRAVYAERTVEWALDGVVQGKIDIGPETMWTEAILMKAATLLDHRSIRSLRHYLNNIINSRIQKSIPNQLHELKAEIAEKKRTAAALDRRIERQQATVKNMMKTAVEISSDPAKARSIMALEVDIQSGVDNIRERAGFECVV